MLDAWLFYIAGTSFLLGFIVFVGILIVSRVEKELKDV